MDEIDFRYTKNTKADPIQDLIAFMNDLSPDFVEKWIPDKYLNLGASNVYLDKNEKKAYADLPRTSDGKLDVMKIKASFAKARKMISAQNAEARKTLEDYGAYKKAINDTNLLIGLFGPEAAHFISQYYPDEIPGFLKEGFCLFDNDVINKVFDNIFKEGSTLRDLASVKSSVNILKDIQNQEKNLDDLGNFDIINEEDARTFLDEYLKITGTTFSCDRIDKYYTYKDSLNDVDSMEAFAASCGSSSNFQNAVKNEIITNVFFYAFVSYLIPSMINKIQHPVAKVISSVIPTWNYAAESLTSNCKDGEIINMDNVTLDNAIDIVSQGIFMAFMINFNNAAWIKKIDRSQHFQCGKILTRNKFSPSIKNKALGTFCDIFIGWPSKISQKVVTPKVTAAVLKSNLHDVTTVEGAARFLEPTYNLVKLIADIF